jgi:hypothetical protein
MTALAFFNDYGVFHSPVLHLGKRMPDILFIGLFEIFAVFHNIINSMGS